MPHIVIEYAAVLRQQLDIGELVSKVHKGAIASGLFNPDAVKTRAYACDDYLLGQGDANDFIHIRMSIMPGRSDSQKQQLTQSVWQAMSALAADVSCVSVEVAELHQPSYLKQEH
ncbi:5-carboxymethyl-2-hydroxymuconate Delta-isomerase [Shewanella dokdonensis]|uniref:5-carboxymethyl-2-hydroxymuconate Delta-isomerase n=1 Tax=Shewanella dokdonensis TaxID=712036 RepID=A0ABX8DDS6_9GAMM|nr:5-carboxymethyl-2-hydroxymuconate Delta-isomerase [Shewanella dokdonensis]MCL1073269.1 5-carboxymethyl-2-hydroxymuconate Delta-isomerase [Shewanella dokdonensis]QVK22892.1 5-carboxymethyl-2-hydroxymuconate Delta-isomerase [Shewanella dokdonensis]